MIVTGSADSLVALSRLLIAFYNCSCPVAEIASSWSNEMRYAPTVRVPLEELTIFTN